MDRDELKLRLLEAAAQLRAVQATMDIPTAVSNVAAAVDVWYTLFEGESEEPETSAGQPDEEGEDDLL